MQVSTLVNRVPDALKHLQSKTPIPEVKNQTFLRIGMVHIYMLFADENYIPTVLDLCLMF